MRSVKSMQEAVLGGATVMVVLGLKSSSSIYKGEKALQHQFTYCEKTHFELLDDLC